MTTTMAKISNNPFQISNFIAILLLTSYYIFPPCLSLTIETQALLDFKNHLKDSLNTLASWNESNSPCNFHGITCDPLSFKVIEISLEDNSLSGEIFSSISVLHSLQVLSLPSNSISGKIPSEVTKFINLKVLNLSGNELVGAIPDMSGLRNLQVLDLSANYFSGRIPSWIGKLTGLVSLGLGENLYTESVIPESLGNLKNLTWLYLRGSHLTGEIPESIYEMEALETLDISRNRLTGKISRSISKLKNVYKIELFSNNLVGELPEELANLTNLQEIDLSANKMSGKLPKQIGDMKNLVVFQLYDNNFSGEIPDGFGDMENLKGFSVYRNMFNGTIPENFGRFSPLESIDISENQFSGFNNFSGEVSSEIGNSSALSEIVLMNNMFSDNGQRRPIFHYKYLMLFFIAVIFGAVVLIGRYVKNRRGKKLQNGPKEGREKWKLASFHQVDIDADEISHLKEDNLIGYGGAGKVYRVQLRKNGGVVAVKQLEKGNNVRILAAEIEILGKIRHKNILKLYACFLKGETSLLVYEYMPNGNLFQALHRETKDEKVTFDWNQRYKIALGGAKGICYLHHDCSPPVIHRDIKSSNILLDENYEAKIADFGVARFAEKSQMDDSSFAGTHGYIAP
ncbi:receptor-like protein kinase HSL1-like protein, partial [Trifolium pratense]